jgi:hypothetical protein
MWLPLGKISFFWGIAAICWVIWKSRNKVCFENKQIKNPLEIICYSCALMKYWTGLFAEMDKEDLIEGVNTNAESGRKSAGGTTQD